MLVKSRDGRKGLLLLGPPQPWACQRLQKGVKGGCEGRKGLTESFAYWCERSRSAHKPRRGGQAGDKRPGARAEKIQERRAARSRAELRQVERREPRGDRGTRAILPKSGAAYRAAARAVSKPHTWANVPAATFSLDPRQTSLF